jgi:hypothetical protein
MIRCPNCKAEIEVRAVAANTTRAVIPPTPKPNVSDVGDLLASINPDALNDYEREFIETTRERYEKYGDEIRMSPKQMNVLRGIAGKDF